MHAGTVVLLAALGAELSLGPAYAVGVAVVAALLAYENATRAAARPVTCERGLLHRERSDRRSRSSPAWSSTRPSDVPAPLLEIDGVGHAFGERVVLRDVHLRVEAGASLALFGPNGAGKSTLLRAVAGLLRPLRGEVRIDGDDCLRWRCPRSGGASATSVTGRSSGAA